MFKEPDFRDPIARYLCDKWYKDFWQTRTWFGRVLFVPVAIPAAVLILIIALCSFLWVKTQR